jgi:hypothetical protein
VTCERAALPLMPAVGCCCCCHRCCQPQSAETEAARRRPTLAAGRSSPPADFEVSGDRHFVIEIGDAEAFSLAACRDWSLAVR